MGDQSDHWCQVLCPQRCTIGGQLWDEDVTPHLFPLLEEDVLQNLQKLSMLTSKWKTRTAEIIDGSEDEDGIGWIDWDLVIPHLSRDYDCFSIRPDSGSVHSLRDCSGLTVITLRIDFQTEEEEGEDLLEITSLLSYFLLILILTINL